MKVQGNVAVCTYGCSKSGSSNNFFVELDLDIMVTSFDTDASSLQSASVETIVNFGGNSHSHMKVLGTERARTETRLLLDCFLSTHVLLVANVRKQKFMHFESAFLPTVGVITYPGFR
jgi:hypothetical protein